MADRKKVTIRVYNKEFSIVSSEEPEVTAQYAAYIDQIMRDIGAKTGSTEEGRVALLALLQITHELFALRKKMASDGELFDKRVEKLLREMDAAMELGGVQTDIISRLTSAGESGE